MKAPDADIFVVALLYIFYDRPLDYVSRLVRRHSRIPSRRLVAHGWAVVEPLYIHTMDMSVTKALWSI
jgi:hypothetical protein